MPHLVSLINKPLNVLMAGYNQFGEVLNVGSEGGVLPDLEVSFVLWIEQVADSLAVNLHVADLDIEGENRGGLVPDAGEELLTQPRNDSHFLTKAHHGVTLAGASLSVREEAGVVALKRMIQHLLPNIIVNHLLRGKVAVTLVKGPVRVVEGEWILLALHRENERESKTAIFQEGWEGGGLKGRRTKGPQLKRRRGEGEGEEECGNPKSKKDKKNWQARHLWTASDDGLLLPDLNCNLAVLLDFPVVEGTHPHCHLD